MGILPPFLDAAKSESLDLPSQTLTEDEEHTLNGLLADAATD
jgi:hypothetical protein